MPSTPARSLPSTFDHSELAQVKKRALARQRGGRPHAPPWPRALGTSGRTSPESRASSCPTPAVSQPTRENATTSPRGTTKHSLPRHNGRPKDPVPPRSKAFELISRACFVPPERAPLAPRCFVVALQGNSPSSSGSATSPQQPRSVASNAGARAAGAGGSGDPKEGQEDDAVPAEHDGQPLADRSGASDGDARSPRDVIHVCTPLASR